MPPDTTRAASSKRSQRKVTEEELKDIELKRIRGILSAGQGTRFILADTEHLHKKIADMSHRIRQLEDALAIIQATVSDQRHPLLEDELLKVKFGPEATDGHQQTSSPTRLDQKITQSIDALGTLTLGDAGEVKYFGRSAGSETLMVAGEDWDDDNETETEASDENDDSSSRTLSPEVASIGNLFPSQGKRSCTKTLPLLEAQLPTQERAWALGESYLLHAANFFRPIKREELFESFLPGIYNAARAPDPANEGEQLKNTPHALATLFFLFAMGALLDLSLPAFNDEAEHYYDLGRTALSLRPVFDAPQVDTIQALGLMATYHCLAGKKYSRDSAVSPSTSIISCGIS
ncbi:hypothetical protein H0H81_006562 [Sphagnurus paluster]|uniref:Transcription factor domain-containing protein n=1 Tax=Sphagnurus paluster TaxID=117069 RepID=A0A9P7KMV4_9AGAR|nr:hypothetical protein H0H81_006562 [Sphagnurus paluster]